MDFKSITKQGYIDQSWIEPLNIIENDIDSILKSLKQEKLSGIIYLPQDHNIFRAFSYPIDNIKVIILGQDPYPNPKYPIGLAFAVNRNITKIPQSLKNIYTELENDTGIIPPKHGDISSWCNSGVMLLNRVLTVKSGYSKSHINRGWEKITAHAIESLASRGNLAVAILWGKEAQKLESTLNRNGVQTICSAHPSPLSAFRGFFGSKPFTRTNKILMSKNLKPIDWKIH